MVYKINLESIFLNYRIYHKENKSKYFIRNKIYDLENRLREEMSTCI